MSSLRYRADVDGLRAIPLLIIIAHHYQVPGFEAGYIAPDIFFAVSGYLIARWVFQEVELGRFSFQHFYARRILRLFPALVVVIFSVVGLSIAIHAPTELASIIFEASTALIGLSNFFYWKHTGYFEVAAEYRPLLTTWTLGVEEQFYLFFPILVVLTKKWSASWGRTFLFLAGLGLLLSVWITPKSHVAAYFLLPTRAWVFSLGAAIAAWRWQPSAMSANLLSWLGVALMVGAMSYFEPGSLYPSWRSLLPGLITVCWLLSEDSRLNRTLFSNAVLVGIGQRSYSIYLWHWPMIYGTKLCGYDVSSSWIVAMIVLSITALVSELSYQFVEMKWRKHRAKDSRVVLLFVTVCFSGLITFLTLHTFFLSLPSNTPVESLAKFLRASDAIGATYYRGTLVSELVSRCHLAPDSTTILDPNICVMGDSSAPAILVWGDSHAPAIHESVVPYARGKGDSVFHLSRAGCPPIHLHIVSSFRSSKDCIDFNVRVLSFLKSSTNVHTVILVSRWTSLSQTQRQSERLENSLRELIGELQRGGKRVVITESIPSFGFYATECAVARSSLLGNLRQCSMTNEQIARTTASSDLVLTKILQPNDMNLCSVKPRELLCPSAAERCDIYLPNGELSHLDDDHLTPAAGLYLSTRLWPSRCY